MYILLRQERNIIEAVEQRNKFACILRVHYGLLKLRMLTDAPPMRAESFALVKHQDYVAEGEEPGIRFVSLKLPYRIGIFLPIASGLFGAINFIYNSFLPSAI